ncbi:MAG: UvrD-helicase domain-containing protein [Chloroflexi bacterium]|nr:UvrD-helicase domain-containing protein [Chloroflexota bacterium]
MDLLSGLNSAQRQAVTAGNGPVLVLAGPGSGKTRVLTHRAAYLVGHVAVPPYRIMAVTFTNKAAREMRGRIETVLGGSLRGLTIGTFHSICARLLRREAAHLPVTSDFVIFDESDQVALAKQALRDLDLDEKQYRPQSMLNAISKAKNELITPEAFRAETYFAEIAGRVYARYQALLHENNALDFDDLLMGIVMLFDDHPDVLAKYQQQYEHILVDEFQDTNTAQYAMLRQLAAVNRNLFAVGDVDQAIYRWRGADYRNVHRFQDDHPDALTVLLEQNYRSTQTILDAAMAVIDRNPNRTRKSLFTERGHGERLTVYEAYNEDEEAQFVVETIATLTMQDGLSPGECAVMYRTNAQSRAVEDAFIRAGLPYRLVGATRFYARREIKDLLAYLRLVHNPADSVSLARVLNVPPRGIGPKTIEALQACAAANGVPMGDILRGLGQEPPAEVQLAVTGKALKALADFGRQLNYWHTARAELSVVQLMDVILDQIGYHNYLNDGTDEGLDRWDNVVELRGVAAESPDAHLTGFLEEVSLVSDVDNLAEDGQAPTLLTLHAAKGLEFPVVFILGLDDGILPHQRSFDDPEQMAEERRLMYVGLTRAKDRLYLLRAFRRTQYGESDVSQPSRFLEDIPDHLVAGHTPRRTGRKANVASAYARATTWDGGSKPAAAQPVVLRFRTGQRVNHSSFGEGIVIESKASGGDEIVSIAFEAVGLKRLAASMANLELLEG